MVVPINQEPIVDTGKDRLNHKQQAYYFKSTVPSAKYVMIRNILVF